MILSRMYNFWLVKEIKPLVTEKDECEYRYETKLKELWGKFGLTGFLDFWNWKFFSQMFPRKLEVFDWDLDKGNGAVVT